MPREEPEANSRSADAASRAGSMKRCRNDEDPHPNQVISIVCGNETFRSHRRTWTLVESVLSVAVEATEPRPEAAELDLFIDEPSDAFALVVAYLQSRCENDEPPACDRSLAAYALTARRLGFVRLAASLKLEQFRRRLENEAAYLDAHLERVRLCIDASHWKPVAVAESAGAGAAHITSPCSFNDAIDVSYDLRNRRLVIQGLLSRLPERHRRRVPLVRVPRDSDGSTSPPQLPIAVGDRNSSPPRTRPGRCSATSTPFALRGRFTGRPSWT